MHTAALFWAGKAKLDSRMRGRFVENKEKKTDGVEKEDLLYTRERFIQSSD
jgi:hypothetical protein